MRKVCKRHKDIMNLVLGMPYEVDVLEIGCPYCQLEAAQATIKYQDTQICGYTSEITRLTATLKDAQRDTAREIYKLCQQRALAKDPVTSLLTAIKERYQI